MEMNMFVKHIKLDEEKRILISIQEQFLSYLQDENNKKMLKDGTEKILKDDFKKLEIGKNIIRITVAKGTEEKSLELVKEELVKALEMAMTFMSQMGEK